MQDYLLFYKCECIKRMFPNFFLFFLSFFPFSAERNRFEQINVYFIAIIVLLSERVSFPIAL